MKQLSTTDSSHVRYTSVQELKYKCGEFIQFELKRLYVIYRHVSDYFTLPRSNTTLLRRCGIVDIVCDCYTGGHSSIPTHADSPGKWMNLRPGQPMPCEGNWVVSSRCWRDTYKMFIIARMGFSAPAIQPYRNSRFID